MIRLKLLLYKIFNFNLKKIKLIKQALNVNIKYLAGEDFGLAECDFDLFLATLL